jgi:hypothetical protein
VAKPTPVGITTHSKEIKVRNKKQLIGVGVITTTLLAAGVAFAAWNAGGTGSGYAKATTAQALSTVAATTTAQLYPGGTADVEITIHNPNPYPVSVTSISGNGAITSDKGAACNASTGVTYTDRTGTFNVAANADASFTLTGAVAMSNASDNACQGAVFTVPVSLTGASNA